LAFNLIEVKKKLRREKLINPLSQAIGWGWKA